MRNGELAVQFTADIWFWLSIAVIIILLIFSGFFSGSETALTAASKASIRQLEKNGDNRAGLVNQLIQARERLIGSLLLGNNLVNILASAIATSIFIRIFGELGVVYTTIIMTALVLVFAEILPKTWAIITPDRFALNVAPVVRIFVAAFGPPVAAIEYVVRFILRRFGIIVGSNQAVLSAHDELRGAVDLQHHEGGLVKEEKDRLGGVLDLADLEVSDVMIHRTQMVSLDVDTPPEILIQQVLDSPFTRLPLWQDNKDNIVGVLHVKDLLRKLYKDKFDANASSVNMNYDLKSLAKEPWFIPDTTSLEVQLNAFLKRKRKSHFALVVDEYGEVMGHVTLEDILEEIVGEIADEHDVEMAGVMPQPDGSVIVEGSVTIRDLIRATDWQLPDEEATTIAGLVIHEAQMIPDERQIFAFHGFRFVVLKKEKNRIIRLRVIPEKTTSPQVQQ